MGNCLVLIHKKQQTLLAAQLDKAAGPQVKRNIPVISGVGVGGGGAAIRIKLVISKQELKEMMRNGGFCTGDLDMGLLREERRDFEGKLRGLGWSPALESIDEGDDDL